MFITNPPPPTALLPTTHTRSLSVCPHTTSVVGSFSWGVASACRYARNGCMLSDEEDGPAALAPALVLGMPVEVRRLIGADSTVGGVGGE